MKVMEQPTNRRVLYDKNYGRQLTTRQQLLQAFRIFFEKANGVVLDRLLEKLCDIQHWFRDNNAFCFTASSLLVAYDKNNTVSIKMIDFGRVRLSDNGDNAYGYGLQTLYDLWTSVRKEMS